MIKRIGITQYYFSCAFIKLFSVDSKEHPKLTMQNCLTPLLTLFFLQLPFWQLQVEFISFEKPVRVLALFITQKPVLCIKF